VQEQLRQIGRLSGGRGDTGLAHRTSFCALSNLATLILLGVPAAGWPKRKFATFSSRL
jgi:hypothetical protein